MKIPRDMEGQLLKHLGLLVGQAGDAMLVYFGPTHSCGVHEFMLDNGVDRRSLGAISINAAKAMLLTEGERI